MLALPLVAPPEDNTWSGTYIPRSSSPDNTAPHAQNRQARQQRDEEKRMLQARSPLALLAQDEAAIAQRKAAIRNFGAYWIRPPGIPKTLQAMVEEEVERREQEELERQERGLLDLQAQQQLEEQEAQTEQDLDEDVPEATFNEDSMLEGSHVVYEDLEEAELTGIARDEENLGIEHERDLDDSVPEAASFESESEDSIALPTGGLFGRAQTLQREGLPRSPGSMVLSSPQVESSFAASSPVRSRTRRAMRDD